jgi:hypothetical protein
MTLGVNVDGVENGEPENKQEPFTGFRFRMPKSVFDVDGITWINRVAWVIHLLMFILALVGRYGNFAPPQIYTLKYDRVHLVGRAKSNITSRSRQL